MKMHNLLMFCLFRAASYIGRTQYRTYTTSTITIAPVQQRKAETEIEHRRTSERENKSKEQVKIESVAGLAVERRLDKNKRVHLHCVPWTSRCMASLNRK